MDIPLDVNKFRIDRANEIKTLVNLLEKTGIRMSGGLFPAIKQLENKRAQIIPHNNDVKDTYWGYNLKNFFLEFDSLPRHLESNIKDLRLLFEIHLVADYNDFFKLIDPFKHLAFEVVLYGDYHNYITAFHLDRHLESANEPDAAHPIYHIHFGGDKLEKDKRKFGQALLLDTPRLMHYPMEIILGIDFILSNYFPTVWKELKKNGDYNTLMKKYQEYIWKPYSHAIAKHWTNYSPSEINWSSKNICPTLV